MVPNLFQVGDGFECLHGCSPFDGHKKVRWNGGRDGEPGMAQSGAVRVTSNDYLRGETVMKTPW